MQIDWFTFFAQITNFLVLVWLLKRFLYGPVTRAMERRESFIANRLAEAEDREEAAKEKSAEYQRRLKELDTTREETLRAVQEEAESHRRALFDEAREELAETREQWKQQLEEEKGEHLGEIKRRLSREVCAVSRQALKSLADAELERQMVWVFLGRLAGMDQARRDDFRAQCGDGELVLFTTSELDDELRRRAEETVAALTEPGAKLRFDTTDQWQCGVELEIPGRAIAWTLDDYLHDLEAHLNVTLAEK